MDEKRHRLTKAEISQLARMLRAQPWLPPELVAERLGLSVSCVKDYKSNHKLELYPIRVFVPKLPKKCEVPEGIDAERALEVVHAIINDPTLTEMQMEGRFGMPRAVLRKIKKMNRYTIARALDGANAGHKSEYDDE